MTFVFPGPLPLALQLGVEGPPAQPTAGGPDEALRQPEERGERHQDSQVVRRHRLDRHLPEEGEDPERVRV